MKKLLRSGLFKFLFVLIAAVGLFIFSNYIDAQVNGIKATTEVYVVNKDLDTKHKITDTDIKMIEVLITDEPNYSIADKSQLIDKYVIEPVTKGAFILSHNISDVKNYEAYVIPEGYSMISIPLSIDNAVGWKIEKEQIVQMVFSPIQYKTVDGDNQSTFKDASVLYEPRVLEDVTIIDIMNEATISVDDASFAGTPKYIVVQVKDSDAEFIAKAKDKGRFDILISGTK